MGLVFSDGYTKDIEVIDKEREYTKYILEHITNVQTAYNKLIKSRMFDTFEIDLDNGDSITITSQDMDNIKAFLDFEINDHDQSKFSDEEFVPYRIHFYPTETEKKRIESDIDFANQAEDSFKTAWEHHWTNNPHHGKYFAFEFNKDKLIWEKLDTPKDMPIRDILHMICDWAAMSLKFDGDMAECVTWYNTKAEDEKSYMNNKTRAICEYFLKLFFDKPIN